MGHPGSQRPNQIKFNESRDKIYPTITYIETPVNSGLNILEKRLKIITQYLLPEIIKGHYSRTNAPASLLCTLTFVMML